MKSEQEILEKIQTLDESKKRLLEELSENNTGLPSSIISNKAANDFILKRIWECNGKIDILNWVLNKQD